MKGTGPASQVANLSHSESLLKLDPLYYVTQLGASPLICQIPSFLALVPLAWLHRFCWRLTL